GFLCAERFARTIRFDWPLIDTATEIVEVKTELTEDIDELRAREALKLAACFNAEFFQFPLTLLADSPDFAHRQIAPECGHFFRLHCELAVRLVNFAGDFCDQLVGANACGGGQFRFPKNRVADRLRQRPRHARVRGDIEVSFVEREWLDYGSEPMQ